MNFRTILEDTTHLQVDNIYIGGRNGNHSDDPLNVLIKGIGNEGGFRIIKGGDNPKLIVLSSNQKDVDWPDNLDTENGIYTYYGDNKKPGNDLHETKKSGNALLRNIFEKTHGGPLKRQFVPPILVFTSAGTYRDIIFRGLAVPGVDGLDANNDLVALWRTKNDMRFQNYRAKFTILDERNISRAWLDDVRNGNPYSDNCPPAWLKWSKKGIYTPLKAPRTVAYRNKEQQIPEDAEGIKMIKLIHDHFSNEPVMFEKCAAEITRWMLKDVTDIDVTRPSRDGGRDAVGKLRIGDIGTAVEVDFAMEAKCYALDHSVGVKEMSRLISRLRHRQFGVFVTTSYIALQAYQEIIEDQHPILVISAVDIVRILKNAGRTIDSGLNEWLLGIYDPANPLPTKI